MSKCKKNLHFSVKSRSKPDFHTLIARKMTYIKNKKNKEKLCRNSLVFLNYQTLLITASIKHGRMMEENICSLFHILAKFLSSANKREILLP